MKPKTRRPIEDHWLSPQPRAARADLRRIRAWYKKELGPGASAKALATIEQALSQLQSGVTPEAATRPDLPVGIYRLIAKRHLILFEMDGSVALVLRIVHGARDLSAALDEVQALSPPPPADNRHCGHNCRGLSKAPHGARTPWSATDINAKTRTGASALHVTPRSVTT
jgi:plasmid stabilization system protein ParE